MLEVPRFHHLHLNSVDPDAAIDFYVRHFPHSTRAVMVEGPSREAIELLEGRP